MQRREFLKMIGLGVPGVVVTERMGFFAWLASLFKRPAVNHAHTLALQLEKVRHKLPCLYEVDNTLYAYMADVRRRTYELADLKAMFPPSAAPGRRADREEPGINFKTGGNK